MRTVLVLLAIASFLSGVPRMRRGGSVRRHIELLRGVTPIQQFAPAAYRALADSGRRFDLTIVAHQAFAGAPYELIPVDDRAVAAWLA